MSLSELLEALRESYSLLPTSPTLTDIVQPSSTPPADSSTVMQLDGLSLVAAQQLGTPVVPALLEAQQAPHVTGPAAESEAMAAVATATAATEAVLSAQGVSLPVARYCGVVPAADSWHDTGGNSGTVRGSSGGSGGNGGSSSSDQEVLMAVELLTDSLRMLRETHSLIDSMLALETPPVTAGPATRHGDGQFERQAAGNRDRHAATEANRAPDSSNSTSRIPASSITHTHQATAATATTPPPPTAAAAV
jgi:hypothetical protein